MASGLPREGQQADVARVGDVARQDDVTCRLDERIGNVVEALKRAGKDTCVVTTDNNVILGRLRGRALEADPDTPAEDVMEPGPTTTRTNTDLTSMVERMRLRSVASILVTTSDGRLVGTMYLTDAERRLAATGDQPDEDEASCDCED